MTTHSSEVNGNTQFITLMLVLSQWNLPFLWASLLGWKKLVYSI